MIKKIDDGTVIYIPKNESKKIFLFENLNIYSIKSLKKIKVKIPPKMIPLRDLTSFLERYYERRSALLRIKSFSPRTLRLIKSTIFSYQSFLAFCQFKRINLKKKIFDFKEYKIVREKYSLKKEKEIFFKQYFKKFKLFDKIFYEQSLEVLDSYFKFPKCDLLNYKFNSYTKFSFKKSKNTIIVPKILAYIYKVYAFENLNLSKKIRNDFYSNITKDKKYTYLNNYLRKKILFLELAFNDLKKQKFKKGLYRLNWYLT